MLNRLSLGLVAVVISLSVLAEPTEFDCPQVYAANPYTELRMEGGASWGAIDYDEVALHCRGVVAPDGRMACLYGNGPQSALIVHRVERPAPAGTTCESLDSGCGFVCDSTAAKKKRKEKDPDQEQKKERRTPRVMKKPGAS